MLGWIIDRWGYRQALLVLFLLAIAALLLAVFVVLLNRKRSAHLNLTGEEINRFLDKRQSTKSSIDPSKVIRDQLVDEENADSIEMELLDESISEKESQTVE